MAVSDHLAKAVVKGIEEQMDRYTYHDVIVVVDDTEFKCHRFLLSACSEFFRATFQSGMQEDLNRKVVLKGISSDVFKLIIDSVYYAKEILTADNVSSVWHAANQLQINFLLQFCEKFQTKRLARENCVDIRIDSKLLNSKKLMNLSWDVIIDKFNYLRQLDDILYLDFEDLKSLVSDDNLIVPSEDVVIETIIRWVNYRSDESSEVYNSELIIPSEDKQEDQFDNVDKLLDDKKQDNKNSSEKPSIDKQNKISEIPSNTQQIFNFSDHKDARMSVDRINFLSDLLASSKLMLVSGACIQNLLENKLVLEDPKSFALVRESLRYHLQPGRRHSYCPSYGKYRNTSLLQNVTYVISGDTPMKFSCRVTDGRWYALPAVQQLKCRAVTYEDDIYWTASSGSSQLAYKFDINNYTWRNIAPLNVVRQDHALVCMDNFIYAIGGVNCVSIERFNAEAELKVPGTGKWENYGNLVQTMSNLTAISFDNLIVVFGSETDNSSSTIVQTFNTQTMTVNIFMDSMSGSAKNMTTFQHGEETFALQKNGGLWKIKAVKNWLVNLEFHSMLWGDIFDIYGAVVTNQELLVFGNGMEPQMTREWEILGFEHFKRIRIIERQGYCFLNTVIQKRFLVTPET